MVPDGLVAVVKRACPTCELVAPVLAQLRDQLTIYSQDDPTFPDGMGARDDTALDAPGTDEFNRPGLLATTWFSGPLVVVNGPITRAIGMNSGVNALGQGNRANATIGRALQLVVRNVGGGRPGEVDRATLGNPG